MSASVILLIVLTVVVAALAIYRYAVARNEDNFLHMADSAGQQISGQLKTEHTLSQIDRVGMGLTVATALYGIGLLAFFLYNEFVQRGRF